MCVSVCEKSRKGKWIPEAGAIGNCELPVMGPIPNHLKFKYLNLNHLKYFLEPYISKFILSALDPCSRKTGDAEHKSRNKAREQGSAPVFIRFVPVGQHR